MLKSDSKGANTSSPTMIINSNPDRDKVVKAYAAVASLIGDATRGHTLYTALCAACHRLKNEGSEIGPDLGTVASKPTEQLVEAILDPNRAVEQRYLTQTVTTKDGRELIGMICEETANSITMKLATGVEVILRTNLLSSTPGKKSLMPEGLESVLTPQLLADLLSWIRAK
jgi:putative heme-binding domain-containing protein